ADGRAWTRDGRWRLPGDGDRILGTDHPYLSVAAEELVALCRHPDAGDVVISGWRLGATPVSFPHENGSHGGPGPIETDAFALLPPHVVVAAAGGQLLRPSHLRDIALAQQDAPAAGEAEPIRPPGTLRVLTYNVHSCVGLDGSLSPDRIARVIARYEPDVVALQELDVARPRTGGVDQAEIIAARLELPPHFRPAMSIGQAPD